MSFKAKYSGWCRNCEIAIHEGDTVKYNESDEVVHDSCPEDVSEKDTKEDACGHCHLIHAGSCEW